MLTTLRTCCHLAQKTLVSSNSCSYVWQDDRVGHQSLQMLKVRGLLEQKLKEKGIFDSFTASSARILNEASKSANRCKL